MACVAVTAGPDKSGVKPSVLSLPSGPGSIEGLGESFEPSMSSGTASYAVPLATPPGRAGFGPKLVLAYDGGGSNGPFGLGWRLKFPEIRRKTDKGLPTYASDTADILVYADGEELVPLADGSWRPEIEASFTKVVQLDGGGWKATAKSGAVSVFGSTASARIASDDSHVYKWLIESMTDLNGNQIQFAYKKLGSSPQLYYDKVSYNISGEKSMAIVFEYEARSDVITDHRPRFQLKTAYRCKTISVLEGGNPVRSYRLDYAPVSDTQPLSLLVKVTVVGRDGSSTLPPAQFTYTNFDLSKVAAKSLEIPEGGTFDDPNCDLMDIDADGLPDILDTNDLPNSYFLNLGAKSDGTVAFAERAFMTDTTPANLSSPGVRLADMDGDGKSELVELMPDLARCYGVTSAIDWTFKRDVTGTPGFSFDDPTVQLMDMNNDKLIDVVQSQDGYIFIWLNQASSSWSERIDAVSPGAEIEIGSANTRTADMDGDRMIDLVFIEEGTCRYYPSLGLGSFGTTVEFSPAPTEISDMARVVIADVNGDGRSDILYLGAPIRLWLNLGLDTTDHAKGRLASLVSIQNDLIDDFTVYRQADANGNGSNDILWNRLAGGFYYLDFAPGEQPYLLKTITNGIGRTTIISYKSSCAFMTADAATKPWTKKSSVPVPVVAAVETSDGLASYRGEHSYRDGYYDGVEKEFRGFAGATRRDVGDASCPTLVTSYVFDVGDTVEALKGKPLSMIVADESGAEFHSESHVWKTKELAPSAVEGDARKVVFAYQESKTRIIKERGAGTAVQLKWEYQYDDYGNTIYQYEHGRLDGGWDDERVTKSTYSASTAAGLAAWALDKPLVQTTEDENGVKTAEKRNTYDANWNLTKVEDWVSGETYVTSVRNVFDQYGNIVKICDPLYSDGTNGHYRELEYDGVYHTFPVKETIHTGSTSLGMSATYDYGYGVAKSSTDFNGFTTTYDYDTFGRLTAVTKPPDTSPTVEYYYKLAHKLSGGKIINWVGTKQHTGDTNDPIESRTFYDGLGRKVMTRYDGEESGQIVVSDTVKFNARKQPWKKYLPYFETGTLDFVDPAYNTGCTEHFYDAIGREVKFTQPDGTFATTTYAPMTKTVRDEEQTKSDGNYSGCGYRYVEDGLLDKDGKGRLREVYEIVKLADDGDPGDLTEWKTTYSYDLLDNLTGYIDSRGNQKFMTYDGLGRKTLMNDPDRGKMTYAYDDAGNLIKTIDAKSQTVEYEYDGVNRLTAEYYGSKEDGQPDVQYFYDAASGPVGRGTLWQSTMDKIITQSILSGAGDSWQDLNQDGRIDVADVVKAAKDNADESTVTARNVKGFLSHVKDQSGEEHNSYDARGRVEWVVKKIGSTNYYTEMAYDAMDRVVKLTYPDGSYVTYGYNARGLLESVPGIIKRHNYNPAGQNALLELACGTLTTYHYDNRLRLSQLTTGRSTDGLVLQDLSYTYDAVSNITAITDKRGDETLDKIGTELGIESERARKFNATQSFLYDSLYRLNQAKNASVYGTIDYRYDRIGNMIGKSAELIDADPLMDLGTMSCGGSAGTANRLGREPGDPPGPHAITGTEKGPDGAMTYAYDDNGNMLTDRGMSFTWDFKDRLVGLTNGSKTAQYTYDYTDTRKKKSIVDSSNSETSETSYIDKHCEIRDGKLIKYVYAGSNRVARSESSPANSYQLSPNSFFLHDHLGSTNITLDPNGKVIEQMVNHPFGRQRLDANSGTSPKANYKFTGKETDGESELQYFEARYLCSSPAHFISVDPLLKVVGNRNIMMPQLMNGYNYCRNNPLVMLDPTGMSEDRFREISEHWGDVSDDPTLQRNKNDEIMDELERGEGKLQNEYQKKLSEINQLRNDISDLQRRISNLKSNINLIKNTSKDSLAEMYKHGENAYNQASVGLALSNPKTNKIIGTIGKAIHPAASTPNKVANLGLLAGRATSGYMAADNIQKAKESYNKALFTRSLIEKSRNLMGSLSSTLSAKESKIRSLQTRNAEIESQAGIR